jgi:Uma2 family endonuclease
LVKNKTIMVVAEHLIKSIQKQLETQALVQIPASEEEYMAVIAELPFKIEYHQSEIITMGLSSIWHETIVINLAAFLHSLFAKNDDYLVLGSNAGVYVPKFEGGYYMPDVLVVKGAPAFKPHSKCIITNPFLIIEVLSPSTSSFDTSGKLEEYKEFESLQQLVYIFQNRPKVVSYTRTETPDTWLNQDYKKMEDSVLMAGALISLSDIYRKVQFS